MYEANPLNIFGLRRLSHCPPHFTKVEFNLRTEQKELSDWIYTKLTGRFYLDSIYSHTDGTHIELKHCAAFEIPGEASYFSLFLDDINVNKLS